MELDIADVFFQNVFLFVRHGSHNRINSLHLLNHKNTKGRDAFATSKWSYIEPFLKNIIHWVANIDNKLTNFDTSEI